jgi:hypothetical protein
MIGQQAAALHDLGHAVDHLAGKFDSTPAPFCDHFAYIGLSGAVGSTPPTIFLVAAEHAAPLETLPQDASVAVRLAFRSRAPPTLL